ncbi:DUF4082 domain-containing protein [Saccharothrix xinjiangensis]|uniref:DUF4082 domain-containing protein n=1 Tax=Saccharothrix xinjiangensis TaxID=204798 RepID=A0ABV9XTH2_9PSEU
MPIPDTLTKIRLAGDVRHPLSGAPGTGTIELVFEHPIRDTGNDIIFAPGTVTAAVADGQFLTDEFLSPRQAGISPANQPLTVRVLTDVYADEYRIEIPDGATGTLQLADLAPAENPPAVVTYALASALSDYLLKTGGTLTGPLSWNGTPSASGHLVTKAYADSLSFDVGLPDTRLTGALFCPEDYGNPVGDGVTDDYEAVKAAWDAMLAYPLGRAKLLVPANKRYRVDLENPARVAVTGDKARAALPLPQVPRTAPKRAYGIISGGEAYMVRAAELGGTPVQVNTAGVLFFDTGTTTYTWSDTLGLPCAIGGPDADMTDPVGNSFSNLHFSIENVILRQNTNPSLCTANLEQLSTCRLDRVRIDVDAVLDEIPEPTNPTGAALLLPRSNNNVAVVVRCLITEGYYAGAPVTEHLDADAIITLSCKIGVHTRRPCSHNGIVNLIKLEQCQWGLSGWDPSGEGPDGGVVPWWGWTGRIAMLDIEDYAYNGEREWTYAPTQGAHINDPNGTLNGTIAFLGRVNSEPPAPNGIGIGPGGGSHSLYVIGPSGTTQSPIAIYGADHTVAATRLALPGGPEITEYSLFPAEDGPSSTAAETTINVGVKVNFTAAVEITHLRFWRPAGLDGPITGRVWRFTAPSTWDAVSADVAFTLDAADEWLLATLPTPVQAGPGAVYVPTVHCVGAYAYTLSYWDSGPGGSGIINGPLRAFSNADASGQGCFSTGAITTPPTTSGGGTNYGVDLVVVAV